MTLHMLQRKATVGNITQSCSSVHCASINLGY